MIHSFKVATTLAAQRIVAITAADTVGYPANNQALPIGITKDTVLGITNAIPVAGSGELAKLYFNDTVAAAGDLAETTADRLGSDSTTMRSRFPWPEVETLTLSGSCGS